MPVKRIPLVGVHNQRSIDGSNSLALNQDQQFLNCCFETVKNPVTGNTIFYLSKRPGFTQDTLVSAGNISTGLIKTDILGSIVSAFGSTNSTIYDGQTSIGTITGQALHFHETSLSGIGYVMIRSSDGTGWYYASNAGTTLSYTGTTHTNTTLDSLGSTTGMYSGQLVSKADIPAGTRILSVDSPTSVTLTAAATGSAAGAVTKEPIAKILDADFITTGTNKSGFTDMNGYLFYVSEDGYLYNSNLNTVHLYTASEKIAANISPDLPYAVTKSRNAIIVGGAGSTEFFHNAGNVSGSPLNSDENLFKRVGMLNQRSLVQLEDDIFFVSTPKEGDIGVYLIRGLSFQRISTPAIDRIIGSANAFGNAIYASAFKLGGYSYLILTVAVTTITGNTYYLLNEDGGYLLYEDGGKIILDSDTTSSSALTRQLVYNIELNAWSEWNSSLMTFAKGLGSSSINQIIASSIFSTSGKIYRINPAADTEVYTDDGTAYSMVIRTSAVDFGTDNLKFVNSLTWIGDESSGTVTVEYSDDDYATWITWGTIDLSERVKRLHRGGSYTGGRAYRFTHSANAPVRAQAIDIDYTVGS